MCEATMKFFAAEGPVNCQDHYCLPPRMRLVIEPMLVSGRLTRPQGLRPARP
jgi:hypothetical protein